MIGTMRKHSTWLWSIIIVVVIFAFVIWGTNPGQQGGGPVGSLGRINGQAVTEEDYLAAKKEVLLRFYMQNQRMPDVEAERRGFNLEQETFQWLLMVQEAQKRQIHAGTEAKAAVMTGILRNLQSQGITTLADFENAVLKQEGFTLMDLDRFIGHQIALQQLMAVEGISGELITPRQIESLWRRENQEISVQAVFFAASNYLASVEVSPEALGTFFTNQMARYRIPDRIQVDYVAYPLSNYFAKADEQFATVTNLNELLDGLYQQRGTNYYAGLTPEQAREQIKQEERKKLASLAARQDAAAFADELWRQEPMKPGDMKTIAAQKGLTVTTSTPFDRTSAPEGLDVTVQFTQAAFRLREDEPYAGPLEGEDHVYVITLQSRIPSTNARFEDVRAQVVEDYRWQQATLQARQLGRAFADQLTNSLAAGKTFTEACTAGGFKPQLLPPLSQATQTLPAVEEHTSLGLFKQVAFSTPDRSASGFNFTSDGGFVLYVNSKLAVDEAAMKEGMPRYTEVVRQTLQNEAFSSWFSEQAREGLRETPLNRTPPAEISAPAN